MAAPKEKATAPESRYTVVKHKNQVRTDSEAEIKAKAEAEGKAGAEGETEAGAASDGEGERKPRVDAETGADGRAADKGSEKTRLLKKLYRKIASYYHPDKSKHRYKHRFFHYVNRGNDNENIVMLVYLIHRFELSDVLDLDEGNTAVLRNELFVLKLKETQLSSNIFHKWDNLDQGLRNHYKTHIRKQY